MIDNPLEQPAPENAIERIHTFARDLAYLTVTKGVSSEYIIVRNAWYRYDDNSPENSTELKAKWGEQMPSPPLMIAFGYLLLSRAHAGRQEEDAYILTEKAFSLLDAPLVAPAVFVSYRRRESSALALLVEARLKFADSMVDVFVDKDIPVGKHWEDELRERVQDCTYFVCVIGPQTLQSPNVCDEIEWALAAHCKIVTLTHPGYVLDKQTDLDPRQQHIVGALQKIQSIPIKSESAEDYDSAIRKLLNTMGYSTL